MADVAWSTERLYDRASASMSDVARGVIAKTVRRLGWDQRYDLVLHQFRRVDTPL